jgi:hypothetical protein
MNVFVTVALADLHKELEPHYSDIGRPSCGATIKVRASVNQDEHAPGVG